MLQELPVLGLLVILGSHLQDIPPPVGTVGRDLYRP